MMSSFSTVPQQATPLDPEKRVNYSLGLVLGVDDFEQEQFYFLERDRQHQRALHGYGTLCGLGLTTNGSQVLVSPGAAIDTRGRVIQVPRTQCADLNQWLAVPENRLAVQSQMGSPVGPSEAYVVLCYRECQTDSVPVPGAPCRSEDETLAPSRITETFELRFSATRPDAAEEAGVRRLGDLLRQIQVTTTAGPGTVLTVSEMERRVRALEVLGGGSPLQSSPPVSVPGEVLLLHPRDAEDVLRAALRVWVTEVRPALLASACGIPPEECVLLGGLQFAINAHGQVDPGPNPEIVIDDGDRPYLVTSRVLQESLLRAWGELPQALGSPVETLLPTLRGDVTGSVVATTVQGIQSVPVVAAHPNDGDVLTFRQTQNNWAPAPLPAAAALNGDVAGPAGNNTVQRLRGHPVAPDLPSAAGNVLTWMPDGLGSFRWAPAALPAAGALAGDVTGPPNANVLASINHVALDASVAPASGQVLTAVTDATNTTRWRPQNLPALPANLVRFALPAQGYIVVAAGVVNASGTPLPQPTLGSLSASILPQTRATAQRVLLKFNGYQPPTPRLQYVVKALPALTVEGGPAPLVMFEPAAVGAADPGGLVLAISSITPNGTLTQFPPASLAQLQLMVEISQYAL